MCCVCCVHKLCIPESECIFCAHALVAFTFMGCSPCLGNYPGHREPAGFGRLGFGPRHLQRAVHGANVTVFVQHDATLPYNKLFVSPQLVAFLLCPAFLCTPGLGLISSLASSTPPYHQQNDTKQVHAPCIRVCLLVVVVNGRQMSLYWFCNSASSGVGCQEDARHPQPRREIHWSSQTVSRTTLLLFFVVHSVAQHRQPAAGYRSKRGENSSEED